MDAASGMGRAEAAATAAFLGEALPASLRSCFDAAFVRSSLLYTEFVCRLVLQVFRDCGLGAALGAPGDAAALAARAGLSAAQALVPLDWMLRFLSARGMLEELAGEP